jgi:hypothetical protein
VIGFTRFKIKDNIMNDALKVLVVGAIMGLSASALAVQKDITVNANVDPSLDMTLSDAQPLPTSVDMQYLPGAGLAPYTAQAKIWSNAYGNVDIALVSDVLLYDRAGSATTVPLTVSFGGQPVTTTKVSLTKESLFPGGATALSQGSVAKELKIAQTTSGILAAGNYTGVVSLVLTQPTATPAP